jgi:hypothetical protein
MNGTGSINGMEQAALSPLEHFLRLYPVPEKHKNHIPFPQSGTFICRFQIVRSIPTDFQKVKENSGQKFEMNRIFYPSKIASIARIILVD